MGEISREYGYLFEICLTRGTWITRTKWETRESRTGYPDNNSSDKKNWRHEDYLIGGTWITRTTWKTREIRTGYPDNHSLDIRQTGEMRSS